MVSPVIVEVPADVDVRVDEPRHQRQVAEVDRRSARGRTDADDLAVSDRDDGVIDDAAASVNNLPSANRRGLIGAVCAAMAHEQDD